MDDHAVKILDQAATVLERDGWIQGDPGDAHRGRCLNEALFQASEELVRDWRPGERAYPLRDARKALKHNFGQAIPRWNDHTAESIEDVLLALKQARVDLGGES